MATSSARPSSTNVTDENCSAWEIEPNINPRNGNPISSNSSLYKTYMKACFKKLLQNTLNDPELLENLKRRINRHDIIEDELMANIEIIHHEIDGYCNRLENPIAAEKLKTLYKDYVNQYLNILPNIPENTPQAQSQPRERTEGITKDNIIYKTDCMPWYKNPTKNPRTKRTISDKSVNYQILRNGCFNKLIVKLYENVENDDIFYAFKQQILNKELTLNELKLEINNLQTEVQDYFERNLNYPDTIINIYKDYITYEGLQLEKLFQRESQRPSSSRGTRRKDTDKLILNEVFEPIRDNLDKFTAPIPKHNIINVSAQLMDHIYVRLQTTYSNTSSKQYQMDYRMMIETLNAIVYTLLQLEYTYTTVRKFNTLINDLQKYKTINEEVYTFVDYKDYFKIYILALELFTKYRLYTDYEVDKPIIQRHPFKKALNSTEFIECILFIKKNIVEKTGLINEIEDPLHKSYLVQQLDRRFNVQLGKVQQIEEPKEYYQYIWLFIMGQVNYTKPKKIEIQQSDILTKCVDMFVDVNELYSEYKTKLVTKCSSLVKQCTRMQQIRDKLKELYPIYDPKDTTDIAPNTIEFKNVNRPVALVQFYKLWLNLHYHRNIQSFWTSYFDVTFKNEAAIFKGVQRDLLQTCINQLFETEAPLLFTHNLFIPTEDGSRIYQLNPLFEVSDTFIKELGVQNLYNEENGFAMEDKLNFIQFIGGLFSRCLLANIPIPVEISYYTLSKLYTNKLSKNTYGLYFILDMQQEAKTLFNLLKSNPDELEYFGLEFNDQYPLLEQNSTINSANVLTFLNETGEFLLSSSALQVKHLSDDKIERYNHYKQQYNQFIDIFTKGFIIRGSVLTKLGIDEHILRKLLNEDGGALDADKIDAVVGKLTVLYSTIHQDMTLAQVTERRKIIEHQKQITQWFIDILQYKDIQFPYDILEIERPKSDKDFYYTKFLPKLFYFWTGSFGINLNDKYAIHYILNDNKNALPQAHTCFTYIDIPTTYTDVKDEHGKVIMSGKDFLLRKITTAVFETAGLELFGGTKNCIQKVLAKCSNDKDYNKSFKCGLVEAIRCRPDLTAAQKKKAIKYVAKHSIDFKNATKSQLQKWVNEMVKSIK